MTRFHFHTYAGPTAIPEIAARLRAHAMPWQVVTVEGTEHVHFSIEATVREAAETEILQWFHRAALTFMNTEFRLLRAEVL